MALEDAEIRPDMVVGTSVGAINGAWIAGEKPARDLAEVWGQLHRRDLFPFTPIGGLRGILGRRDHFVSNRGLHKLLSRHVGFVNLEDARVPFTVIATDAQSGEQRSLSTGPAIPAIMASAALPGIFPPVQIDGRPLMDGGVVNNTPITQAIEAGATEVWVLSTGYSCALASVPSGAVAMALHSVALLVQQRLVLETRSREYPVPVHLIPPPCPITVPPTDFSQTTELVERGYSGTQQWLHNGRPHAMPLIPHQH